MPSIFTSGTYIISEELMYSSSIYQDSIFVICNTSLAPVNIILPSVDETKSFSNFILISDASENASANNITISAAVGQTINNASSIVINVDGGSCLCLVSSSSLNQIGGQPITSKWVALQSNQSGGGGSYTANNGLNLSGSTFKLGGSLLENTSIDTTSAYYLSLIGARAGKTSRILEVVNSSNGFALYAEANSAVSGGAIRLKTNGIGILGESSGSAFSLLQTTGGSVILTSNATNNTVDDVFSIGRLTSVLPSIGSGVSQSFTVNGGSLPNTGAFGGRIAYVLTDVGAGTEKTKYSNYVSNNNTPSIVHEIDNNGQHKFNKYGINTFVGTPTKLLGVDASGNVVETTSIAARNYGSFYDTSKQIASGVDTVDAIQLNSTDSSATNGISIVNDTFGNPTEITVTKTSTYNIQFSAQLNRIGGGALRQTSIWLRKNGVDVPNTNTHISVQTNSNKVVAAWNFVISLNAGDNVQLMWSVEDIDIELLYEPQNLLIPHPATPSVILTITEV
jgi:hypothetical protein